MSAVSAGVPERLAQFPLWQRRPVLAVPVSEDRPRLLSCQPEVLEQVGRVLERLAVAPAFGHSRPLGCGYPL